MPFCYSSNRQGQSLGVMARTRLTIWNLVKGYNSKTKNVRVVFLVHDTSSQSDACTGKVS